MGKKKKDDNIAAKMMHDIVSNENTIPFHIPSDHFSFGDGYEDDGYDDDCYDPENSVLNHAELCIESIYSFGCYLSEKDKERMVEKIKANTNEKLRQLKELNIGDVIYIYGNSDENEENKEYLVLMIGMYCNDCGERYRDARDGQYIDEKMEPTLATLGDWSVFGIGNNGTMVNMPFDTIVHKGFEIRDCGYSELGDMINEWIGK